MQIPLFSKIDHWFQNLLGKKPYEFLNIVIKALAIIGLVLSLIAYLMGWSDVMNPIIVGYLIISVIIISIVIAYIIRALHYLGKFLVGFANKLFNWSKPIARNVYGVIKGIAIIIFLLLLVLLFIYVSDWIFGDCFGNVDIDHVHYDRF